MTAEIFLASTLGCLVAIIATCVFCRTVYMPLQRYLMLRAWKRSGLRQSWHGAVGDPMGDYISVGSECRAVPGVLDKAAADSAMKQFEAQQALCLAALDVADDLRTDNGRSADRVVAAAQAFRRDTPPRVRKQMKAMAAFRKAQHAPDDPV